MIRSYDVDMHDIFLRGIQVIKLMKILEKNSYPLPMSLTTYIELGRGDGYYSLEENWRNIFLKMCDSKIKMYKSNSDIADFLGFEEPYDARDGELFVVSIEEDNIVKYIEYIRDQGYDLDKSHAWIELTDMASKITGVPCKDAFAYTWYETLITKESPSLLLLASDFRFPDCEMLENLIKFINFCSLKLKEVGA